MYLAKGTLIMAVSTFVYFQALIGSATEIHYPAVGFFHDKHNVCWRRLKENSHFGQMRLPFGDLSPALEGRNDMPMKSVWYHDVYSKQFFLKYDELAIEVDALDCYSIMNQHLCDDNDRPDNWREARYCYLRRNQTTASVAAAAERRAEEQGRVAISALKTPHQQQK